MNTPTEAAENRFACAIFALMFFAFCIVMVYGMIQAGRKQRDRQIIEATLLGHSLVLPALECPKCKREGRKGQLRVHHTVCVHKECEQRYRVIWNGKYGTLQPKQEADLDFDEWAESEVAITEELKKRVL